MAWKSREDKLPPPSYFTMIVAHLQAAYQGAQISREMMTTLRPYFVEAWRNGRTAAAAAQTTCSCNGREIVPSPVIGVHIAKGSVRPPKRAQRGDVFGADELRQPPRIERLQHKLDGITRKEQKQQSVESRWNERVQTTKSAVLRKEAERRQVVATNKRAELLDEARRIQNEMARLRTELNRVPAPEPTPPVVVAKSPISADKEIPVPRPLPPSRVPTEAADPPKKRRGRKPKSESTERQRASLSSDAQNAALHGTIQGLLPGLAKQLAEELSRETERGKK